MTVVETAGEVLRLEQVDLSGFFVPTKGTAL